MLPKSKPTVPARSTFFVAAWIALNVALPVVADDWPEWRGAGRRGVWTEERIVDRFPAEGLRFDWRVPIGSGFAGPAVADGRVFVPDLERSTGNQGKERLLCLDEKTGKILWSRAWSVDYAGLSPTYATGPRATPTIDEDRVYMQGAMGALHCVKAATGELLWSKDFVTEYKTAVPTWGMTGAPLVHGKLLIALVGGKPDAEVVAFDKLSGKEIWRALSPEPEPGYAQPFIVESGNVSQLIVWTPSAVSSLNPANGEVYWSQGLETGLGMTIATPVFERGHLLVSSFFNGSMMLRLDAESPRAELVWKGNSDSEIETDGLHALLATPVIDGHEVYGVCSYGQLRALSAASGQRLWESPELLGEKARWGSAFIVRQGERYFVNTDRGDLVIAEFEAKGYRELSRTHLIEPTSNAGNRRELGAVHWSHPAYANRHIVVRNDNEITRASLEKTGKASRE
jgi:outer membrane protein assembly factor BamB